MEKNTKVVIIGAGQTGRGFIAPFVKQGENSLTFIDKNSKLIDRLNEEKQYVVSYCGNAKRPVVIDQYKAYQLESPEAVKAVKEAEVVLTAVGGNNIHELIPLFEEGEKHRESSRPLTIVCCENGIHVKQPLVEAALDAAVTEGIIFCTTLAQDPNSLDLLSESYPTIPYDAAVDRVKVDLPGYIPEARFDDLIQRKIYTYNCLSAFVSYVGTYKGYRNYADAANDEEITCLMEKALEPLNEAISREYKVLLQEQAEFSKLAVNKFKNQEIIDTIDRNARDVLRKLGPTERMVRPLRLIKKYNLNDAYLLVAIAAALSYAQDEGSYYEGIFDQTMQISDLPETITSINEILHLFETGTSVKKILKLEQVRD